MNLTNARTERIERDQSVSMLSDYGQRKTHKYVCEQQNSMGECNTILSAYTLYRHLG